MSVETPFSWVVISFSLVITSLSFGAVTAIPILMSPMSANLGWDRTTLSLAHSIAMAAAGISGLLVGYLADRRGFALLSLGSGLALGIGLWLASRAQTPWQLYAAYGLVVGAGQGAFFGPITASVSHWFDRNRGLAMAICLSGQSIGGLTISVLLRQWAELWGWRDAMLLYGLLSSITITLCSLVFVKRPPRGGHTRSGLVPPTLPATGAAGIFAGVVGMLVPVNMGSFVVITHLVAFGEERGFSPAPAAALLAAMLGVTLISRLAGGASSDRGYVFLTLCASALSISSGALTIARSDSFEFIWVGGILFGLGYGALFPACTFVVRSACGSRSAGAWVSMMFLFAFFAAAGGSLLGGILHDSYGGYRIAFDAAAALSALGLAIGAVGLRRPLKRLAQRHEASGDSGGF